jgi:hypothetical protein
MPTYLVESYGPNRDDALRDARERAARAAQLGVGVHYVRTTFVPDDETVLHVFEAASADDLRRAAALAALQHERIVEAKEGRGPSAGDVNRRGDPSARGDSQDQEVRR